MAETVILKGTANYGMRPGQLFLTDQRLYFKTFMATRPAWDMSLDVITGAQKRGIQDLVVQTHGSGTMPRFVLSALTVNKFVDAINNAIN